VLGSAQAWVIAHDMQKHNVKKRIGNHLNGIGRFEF